MATALYPELSQHLRSRAGDYFHELRHEPVQVHLRKFQHRTNSMLYEFDLAGREHRYPVLVKSPQRAASRSASPRLLPDRPRLCALPSMDQKSRFEFLALKTIENHLKTAQDDRFAAIRMLDLLPDGSALVMEKVNGQSLRESLLKASRLSLHSGDRASLGQALHNAGAWLKGFHQLPRLAHTQTRCGRREDFLHSINQFTAYLATGSRRKFCEELLAKIHEAAESVLAEDLPSGLSHGDYAPWNVLSECGGRIRVIDTLARWHAPIYEDLAKFLFGIKVSQQQVFSLGNAYKPDDLAWFEQQFLEGYFGTAPIPYAQIRLFECQTILERWVAFVHAARIARSWRRLAKESRRIVWEMYVKNQLLKMLRTNQPSAA